MNRKEKILKHINKDGNGVEIGPSHNPVAPKREGFNVQIIDHMSRDELVEKYAGHGIDINRIETVDFVWKNQSYADLTGKSHYYDWIIASHLIEHVPDLISFLKDCTEILNDQGVISLVIPDKRYCFDHYRSLTSLAQIIDSHYQRSKIHTPGTVAEYMLNVVTRSSCLAWSEKSIGDYQFVHSLDDAYRSIESVVQQQVYLDVHAWCFVPHSFRLLIHDLFELGLIDIKEIDFYETDAYEFFMTLGKQGNGSQLSRSEMLRKIDGEVKAGIDADRTVWNYLKSPKQTLKQALHKVRSFNWQELFPSAQEPIASQTQSVERKKVLLNADAQYIAPDVPQSQLVSHQKWRPFIYSLGNQPGMRILEIGSREVCRPSRARDSFSQAEYVGFDYLPGKNVDVVGDVHQLSSYFSAQEKFDLVYTSACFEHFAMPWIVATEIAKVLKVGGYIFVETHFSFSSHERPWHFFQFSDMALRVLFSEALGFKCIEAGVSNPIVGRFSSLADDYLQHQPVKGLYCHAEYLGEKVKDVSDFRWDQIDLKAVVGETSYPDLIEGPYHSEPK